MVTAFSAFDVTVGWWIKASFVCFAISMVIAFLARSARSFPAMPSARVFLDNAEFERKCPDHIAAHLVLVEHQLQTNQAWLARHLNVAT